MGQDHENHCLVAWGGVGGGSPCSWGPPGPHPQLHLPQKQETLRGCCLRQGRGGKPLALVRMNPCLQHSPVMLRWAVALSFLSRQRGPLTAQDDVMCCGCDLCYFHGLECFCVLLCCQVHSRAGDDGVGQTLEHMAPQRQHQPAISRHGDHREGSGRDAEQSQYL